MTLVQALVSLPPLTLNLVMPPKDPMKPKPAGMMRGRYRLTSRLDAATLQQRPQAVAVANSKGACNNRHLLVAACVSAWESERARMLHNPAHWQQQQDSRVDQHCLTPVACLMQHQCEQEEAGQRQGVQDILRCVTHTRVQARKTCKTDITAWQLVSTCRRHDRWLPHHSEGHSLGPQHAKSRIGQTP